MKALIFHGCLALRAGAKNVYCVAGLAESVLAGNLVGPLLNLGRLDLNGLAAGSANQVVMVAGGASAIEQFAAVRLKRIGFASLSQIGQSSINGSQADGAAVIFQDQVQLLCANEASCLAEAVANGVFLTGIATLWVRHFA